MKEANYPLMEFHLAREARDRYRFRESVSAYSGAVILSDFEAARDIAGKMSEARDLNRHPEGVAQAGDIHAMGLIDEFSHALINRYRQQVEPEVFARALRWLRQHPGRSALEKALAQFAQDYPVLAVYLDELTPEDYLEGETGGVPHRHAALEEMILLWLANMNPAFAPYRELFDDAPLRRGSAYETIMAELQNFFETQERFPDRDETLINILRAPALVAPNSLHGQLDYIRESWAPVLGEAFEGLFTSLLRGLDFLKEEARRSFFGPGPSVVLDREALAGARMLGPGEAEAGTGLSAALFAEPEYERFSPDSSWMPRVVMIAKSTYVWLDQLSRAYGRDIHRLDHIPDEELDRLARQGFTGLWLIGLWERGRASKTVKQLMGNAGAVASAYSLYDYVIAEDLGGAAAYENLRGRAWQRGIRLASDMVPNHVGIDGRWVIEHPDWFISLDEPPFPAYTFSGPDLSQDERVGVFIEDHYFDHSDAAVVFKRLDRHTGDARYIYHGNDGTSMPWNDTAQLDYLKPNVREAVIQTILHVARQFPIIRFDAAMTLAKRHIQRLWYPHPGTGGDIPSRAQYGMTKAEFDKHMPSEFWREVVDRVAEEVPDTLLLAEAFWMMEGYFVRTLGMHRVYNSAFMNMLKREENDKYRSLMKNTLEFDPEILKRYVNFMNNPDEETAVAQFGKDDKYFGCCIVMATLPGLPMFGHGQIEGFTEKYGMEYRRANLQETPDEHLVRRHEREVFPILHKRYLFAEVENFLLYDFYSEGGYVNENVFAYSNRVGDERALVAYNNKFAGASGWVRSSVAFVDKAQPERGLVRKTLAEGLNLKPEGDLFLVYRDAIHGLEYLRPSADLAEKGLYLELGAFKYHVFMDFREVRDTEEKHYARLAERLGNRGVTDIERARRELEHEPLVTAFGAVADGKLYRRLWEDFGAGRIEDDEALFDDLERRFAAPLAEARRRGAEIEEEAAKEARASLERMLKALHEIHVDLEVAEAEVDEPKVHISQALFYTALNLALLEPLKPLAKLDRQEGEEEDAWLERYVLVRPLAEALRGAGVDEGEVWRLVALTKILLRFEAAHDEALERENPKAAASFLLESLLEDGLVRSFLHVNHYQGVDYFNKEAYESLCLSFFVIPQLEHPSRDSLRFEEGLLAELRAAEEDSEYKLEGLRGYFLEGEKVDTDTADTAEGARDEGEDTSKAPAEEADSDTAADAGGERGKRKESAEKAEAVGSKGAGSGEEAEVAGRKNTASGKRSKS